MKHFFRSIIAMVAVIGVGALVITSPLVSAQIGEGGAGGGVESARGTGVPTNLANGDGSLVKRVINIMLYAIGVVSVIMLIMGGFRYVISGGQKEAVTAAKNTILYAIVGLLVAIFAYAIIKFVIGAAIGTDSATDI